MNLFNKEALLKETILNCVKDGENTNIVDATCGNGYDLEFLSTSFINSKIWALDIQNMAIENSRSKCEKIKDDIQYLNISHLDFFKNTKNTFDLIVFNTGYLPGSDEKVTTDYETTISTLKHCIEKLNKNGIITLMVYTGHDNYEEDYNVNLFLKNLNKYKYIVFKYETVNVVNSPILYIVEKK